MVSARLRAAGVLHDTVPARDATRDELRRVHSGAYLDLVERETRGARAPHVLSTGDVVVGESSLATALRAAGGAVAAVETCAASAQPVFALIRPPGHHAEPDRGMGFCIFNNAAVAARAYRAAGGGPVLVVDFDYHHGNGTQAVAGDGLSYLSTHASPAYPGTGLRSYRLGDDLVANVPLPASGISTEGFVATWEAVLPRVAAAVRPDLLIVSAGFDYVADDPVGNLGVDSAAAHHLAVCITEAAARHCQGRVTWVLEGGYDLDALTESIVRIARVCDRGPAGSSGADPSAIPQSVAAAIGRIWDLPQGSVAKAAN